MLNYRFAILLLILTGLTSVSCRTGIFGEATPAPAQPAAPAQPIVVEGIRTSYADIVEKTSPAVVRILSEGRSRPAAVEQSPFGDDFFRRFQQSPQRPQLQRGVGSGVVVSADGTILTNAHVIEDADRITVLMADDKSFEAKLVGTDKPSDLAVLKIEAQNMPYLTLGNSDTVRVGDIVLAIGNPLGIGQSVTSGIISAKGRRTGLSDGQSFEDFLQTDAPINRGNSGGALVNLSGELVGINSQILSSPGAGGGNIGIGFSIPSNMAKSVMEQLLKDGRVRRGMLGVNIQNLTDDTAKALDLKDTNGVLVSNVRPGSSGDKAGLKRGDIITAINGEKIEDNNVLRNKVASTLPGTEIKLTIMRGGTAQELTAVLDELNPETNPASQNQSEQPGESKEGENGKLGLSLQPLTQDSARQLNVPAGTEGMVVTEVDPNGVAAEAGIARGDVIMEINRQPVKSVDAVQSAIGAAGDRPVLLLVSRGGQVIFLAVRLR